MIISDTKKFIFLHNPKTAGTSIRQVLRHHDLRKDFFWGLMPGATLGRPVDKAHMALDDMKILFPGDFSLLEQYFVFVFARHPLERYVSSFTEFLKHNCRQIDCNAFSRTQFVEMLTDFSRNEISAEKIRYNINYRHFMPQYTICYSSGKCKADYIGRMESISSDIRNLSKILDLDFSLFEKAGKKNRKSEAFSDLHLELPSIVIDIHQRLYEKDYLYFNFDPV